MAGRHGVPRWPAGRDCRHAVVCPFAQTPPGCRWLILWRPAGAHWPGAGRVGNFINGELGALCQPDLPWGMVFAHSGSLQPRHPSQVYQFLLEGLLLFVLLWLYARPRGANKAKWAAAFLGRLRQPSLPNISANPTASWAFCRWA